MHSVNVNKVIDESKFNGYHLLILILCSCAIIFDGYDLVVYGTIVPVLMKDWNISPAQAGALGSYALFGMMIGALVFGPLADKIGRKKVILMCLTLFGLFTLMVGFAQGPNQFGLFRFIAGLGLGGVMPNLIAMITEYSPKAIRSTLVTIMFSGMQVGAMIAAGVGIAVIPSFGWRGMFFIGGLPLLLLPLFLIFMPESMNLYVAKNQDERIQKWLKKLSPGYKPVEGEKYSLGAAKAKGMPVVSLFENNRTRSTSMFWVTMFMSLLMTYALQTWLPKLMQNAGYSMGSSLLFMVICNVGAIIGAVIGGLLADRINGRKVIIVFYAISFIAICLLSFKSSTFIISILVTIAGATTMGTQIVCNAYVSQYYPNNVRSTGIGWSLGIGRLGGIFGPMMVGSLLSMNLSLQLNFIAIAIPGLIAAFAMMIVQEKYNSASTLATSREKLEADIGNKAL
ncbi:MFS transporter [Candidatus Formimonas warabiya]|uniref:MFS transporter n=1 Tax=Formimonas warabiya TaxID=1761012 RepID=A0A3G1KUG9_FORW1|nr:aromatic acid/H+ symport family MFS transporter [Candidatus Formimonas warabiya]ATW26092.1 MFS transporter [Candidatus Formimonas warabiya]